MNLLSKLFKSNNDNASTPVDLKRALYNEDSIYFAVIDTETTWSDEVMSIGLVIADASTNRSIAGQYYIISPTYRKGGMYSGVLNILKTQNTITDSRKNVIADIKNLLSEYHVEKILAYNAKFDFNHLPELRNYDWCDIMRLAAYRQYNPHIPSRIKCCKTGRIKKGYGVEPIYQVLSGDRKYREIHNAFTDAVDELKIVEMLGHDISTYEIGLI